jgi:hypothetical protein
MAKFIRARFPQKIRKIIRQIGAYPRICPTPGVKRWIVMSLQALRILDSDQFQAAVKAARDRFAMLKAKHPTLNANPRTLTIP